MSVKRITLAFIVFAAFLVLAAAGLQSAVKTKDSLNLKDLRQNSRQSDIKTLDIRYRELNQKLDKATGEKTQNQAEVQKLLEEKEQLEQQKQELEQQLQAKAEKQQAVAQASQKAVNTLTGTATVSAQSNDTQAIIIAAADKYGVSRERALRMAKCESTFNPKAVNYGYYEQRNGVRYYPSGLYQHITLYWPARAVKYGYAGASVFDPVANANVTMGMLRDGGAALWECK